MLCSEGWGDSGPETNSCGPAIPECRKHWIPKNRNVAYLIYVQRIGAPRNAYDCFFSINFDFSANGHAQTSDQLNCGRRKDDTLTRCCFNVGPASW